MDNLCPGCFERERPVEGESCPLCGYVHDQNRLPLSIPIETKLKGRYVVGRILGEPGGFGVTYLSYDRLQEKRVAIKEYMPREIAGRDTDGVSVVPHSGKGSEEFEYGKEQFLEEAKTLARFDHANIVSVQDFFEDNGTAYLVMEYYEGKPLDQYLADQPDGRMDPEVATEIMLRVLDGLKEIHAKGYLHRDVKPENVYLTKEGRPILIDFGAARQAVGERSRSLSVMMTPGYAPYEQYRRDGDQGPHTDVYGAGATLYRMLTGKRPPPATDRVVEDTLEAPHKVNSKTTKQISKVVQGALAVGNKERPRSAEILQKQLQSGSDGALSRKTTMAGQTVSQEKFSDSTRQKAPADPQRGAGSAETAPNKKTEEQTSGSNKRERTGNLANIIGLLMFVIIMIIVMIIVVSYFLK